VYVTAAASSSAGRDRQSGPRARPWKQAGPKLNRQPCGGTLLGKFEVEIGNSHAKEEP